MDRNSIGMVCTCIECLKSDMRIFMGCVDPELLKAKLLIDIFSSVPHLT